MSDAQSLTHRSPEGGTGDNDHGNTPAAWTTVTIVMVASAVGTLAVILANWTLFAGAVVLAIVGPIVGKAMQAAGYGQPSRSRRARGRS